MILWVAVGVFISLVMGAVAVYALVFSPTQHRRQALRRRLKGVVPKEERAKEQAKALMRDQSLSSNPFMNRILGAFPRMDDVKLLIHQAGSPLKPGSLVIMCVALGVVGLMIGLALRLPVLGIILTGVGGFLPVAWLRFQRSRRLGLFDEQFPDAVDLMARAIRAGHSFGSSLSMVVEELEDPVRGEFAKTLEDYSYGKTLEESLVQMVDRVGLQDVKFFATAVIMQRETGGNLTETLDNIGYIIRERFRLMRQVKTLSAEGRLSGTILCLLAPVMFLVLYFLAPHYINMMLNHPLGEILLWTGTGFQVMGILVIRSLIKIRV